MQQLKCVVLQAGQAELRNVHRIQCQYTEKQGDPDHFQTDIQLRNRR